MRKFYFFSLFFLFSFLFIYLKIKQSPSNYNVNYPYTHKVTIKNADIWVEIADTPEKMTKGLSGRQSLAQSSGMLFIYPSPTITSFWMPDMNFPIDIIFIKGGQIVKIYPNVPSYPSNYPKEKLPLYPSEEPIDMVLETVAGWAVKNNIKIGDEIFIE